MSLSALRVGVSLLVSAAGLSFTAQAATIASRPASASKAPVTAAESTSRQQLSSTPIIGHRELPKVLYIVPWRKPQAPAAAVRPAQSVLDEPLRFIDLAPSQALAQPIQPAASAANVLNPPLPAQGVQQ